MTKTAPSTLEARWHRLVQYRWLCEECGDRRQCAAVPYHGQRVRLCLSCFLDGFYRSRP